MAFSTFESAFKQDIDDILRQPMNYKPYFLLGVKVHTALGTLDENQGVVISGMMINRNYLDNEMDFTTLDLSVRQGTYVYDLYPCSDDLEATVTMYRQERDNGQAVTIVERFKLVYLLNENSELPRDPTISKDNYDKQPPVVVRFQLVSLGNMALRVATTQGVYGQKLAPENKDMKSSALLKSIISHECNKITVDTKPIVNFLEIEETHNTAPMSKVVIPTGTRLMDLPFVFQEEKGGMYNSGMGVYAQRYTPHKRVQAANGIFIYSLYDGQKYEESEAPLMFYIPPDGTHNMFEKTYQFEPTGALKMLTQPIKGLYETKKAIQSSQGEGFRIASSDAIADRQTVVTPNGPEFKKTQNVTEVAEGNNENGLMNAPHEGITSNIFEQTSKVLARKGDYVKLVVDNLDPDYVYPGAPCKITYEVGDRLVQRLLGVLHKVQFQFYFQVHNGTGEYTTTEHPMTSRAIFDIFVTHGADE